MTLHREGIPFVFGSLAIAGGVYFISPLMVIVPLVFLVLCLIFFRNPNRTPHSDVPSALLAPADGRVIEVVKNVKSPMSDLDDQAISYTRLSIFLSLMNVHVTRSPIAGEIGKTIYKPGAFFHAGTQIGIERNETNTIQICTVSGNVFVVQSTGAIARRILCYISLGDYVSAADEIGFIRFGSRVDLLVPDGFDITVVKGEKILGGVSKVGEIRS